MKNKMKSLLSILLAVLLVSGSFTFGMFAVAADATEIISGDVDDNGTVDIRDLLRLRQYLANYNYDTGEATFEIGLGSDMNGDGKITSLDIVCLRDYLVNKDFSEDTDSDSSTATETVTETETMTETVTVTETETVTETVTETECEHNNLTAWYYYDDGDSNTYELREARDCADCEENMIETRKAASYGYFQKIEGNASYGGSGVGTIDLSSKSVTASDEGVLKIQFFMALVNGGFDTAVYRITGEDGVTSDWITLATRGNGISGVDAGTKAAMTEMGLDGNNTSLITTANAIDLSDYGEQTVSVELAVISKVAEDNELSDKYVICANFVNVAVPWVDTRPTLDEIAFGAIVNSVQTNTQNGGNKTISGTSADANCGITVSGWCAVDGGVYKYVWSADGGSTWNDNFGNSDRIKTPTSDTISTTGQAHSGKTFADFEGSKTNSQFQSGGIYIDLSAYAKQTVDIIFAAIPVVNQDVKIILCTFEDVSCPAAVSDAYFGASIKVNGATTAVTPSTSKGVITVTGVTADANCQINLNGWCAVDGGVYKYVWSVDGGKTWNEDFLNSERIKTPTSNDIVSAGQSYSGKTFSDLEGAKTNAQFQSGGINIDLSEYAGSTLTVTFAAVPVKDADKVTPILIIEDVAVPTAE